jgi:hypothetical protein
MEAQIMAEARGVSRKEVSLDSFRSIYLWDAEAESELDSELDSESEAEARAEAEAEAEAQSQLDINSVKQIGNGDWEESIFFARLSEALSEEVHCP